MVDEYGNYTRKYRMVYDTENFIDSVTFDTFEDAKADLDTGITKIKLDTDKVSDDDIKEAVEEAGFNVE